MTFEPICWQKWLNDWLKLASQLIFWPKFVISKWIYSLLFGDIKFWLKPNIIALFWLLQNQNWNSKKSFRLPFNPYKYGLKILVESKGGGQKNPLDTFANCSAHRPPTEMILYSMERPCPQDFKKYKIIQVGGLRAEQFAIKVDWFYREKKGVTK